MSAAASIQLTPAQLQSIVQCLTEVDTPIMVRAIELNRQRAIRSIAATESGVTAKVQGGQLYTTTLRFTDSQAITECSCPYEGICKHATALLSTLRREAIITATPRNQVQRTALKKALPESPPSTAFEAWIKDRLGRPFNARTNTIVKSLEKLWIERTRMVQQQEFLQIFGIRIWGYQHLELWPQEYPPANEAEFFAYLALALKACHQFLPSPLDELAKPELVKHLHEQRQHLKDVAEWKAKLKLWDDTPETPPTEYILRLQLHDGGANVQVSTDHGVTYKQATQKLLKELGRDNSGQKKMLLGMGSYIVLKTSAENFGYGYKTEIPAHQSKFSDGIFELFGYPELFAKHVVSVRGTPLQVIETPLKWALRPPTKEGKNYRILLQTAEGKAVASPLAVLPSYPICYVTSQYLYVVPNWPFKQAMSLPIEIPREALESSEGIHALAVLNLEPPAHLATQVLTLEPQVSIFCNIHRYEHSQSEYLRVRATASLAPHAPNLSLQNLQWKQESQAAPKAVEGKITHLKKAVLTETSEWLSVISLRPVDNGIHHEARITSKNWPEVFTEWMSRRPNNIQVHLDPELQSIKDGIVGGSVWLDVEESENRMDWFDLKASIQVNDLTLTQDEIDLLLKAKGKWVKLSNKGWRKLNFEISVEQQAELDELGLSLEQFTGEKQQLHALQLGALAKDKNGLLPAEHAQKLQRRLEDIHTRVTPDQPVEIQATLRPYQTEGFHFLSYLSANRFGGILADDMGLGKTLQTLTWIAWLRAQQKVSHPALVVCPKSVQDNWRAEAERFYPGLKVAVWDRSSAGKIGLDGNTDLLVIHYPQLRIHETILQEQPWSAVILDEAQAIKNPTSQNNKAACGLNAQYRLALTGTPIENRLMDLWAIFAFAMPGALGTRASFNRLFNASEDPNARRRLAARTKPFLLRRTKKEVATDLPDRVEEDLVVEMEGTQAALYHAEIKRARAQLLKVQTSTQLDKARFNILTSLLRLRQICCDPRLVGLDQDTDTPRKKKKTAASDESDSAKLTALVEQLEPIIEDGQKVLVFSQFVEMLNIIKDEVSKLECKVFILTGDTDDRGALVKEFQEYEGPAVFLISLKAGGFGLNLTAASYVVLYDPWWNPAVEAQAIDRTHRIGQKQTVFAYRLIIKDSVEEKIRQLQKQKGALAQDILGEESFSQGLTLSDFQFLLG